MKGQDVVQDIERARTDKMDRPLKEIRVVNVEASSDDIKEQ